MKILNLKGLLMLLTTIGFLTCTDQKIGVLRPARLCPLPRSLWYENFFENNSYHGLYRWSDLSLLQQNQRI